MSYNPFYVSQYYYFISVCHFSLPYPSVKLSYSYSYSFPLSVLDRGEIDEVSSDMFFSIIVDSELSLIN